MSFKDQIEKSLRNLNNKQLCLFSWMCCLRALPFLSVKRGFAYWPENNRQKHLYSIFSALDTSVQAAFVNDFKVFARNTAKAYAAADDAFAARVAYIDRATADIDAARDVIAAASAAADVTIATADIYGARVVATARVARDSRTVTEISIAKAARIAAGATAIRATDAAAEASAAFDLKSFLLKDIEAIKENKLNECNRDTSVYGKVWGNFQEDLKAIGCAYWARLYENLFNNGFEIDKKQLERRLGVPDEIKAEGAAAVGRYLEKLGDEIERLNEARIIILGEKGAGKTSLARKLLDIDAEMPKGHESTEGVEKHLWDFSDKDGARSVNAHIWDFAGHSITHSAHRCFMSARCLYIYVYNGRIERDNDPAYWLEQIRINGGDSPVLFLINEKDDHNADIAEKTLKNEYPSIAGYYRVDIGGEDKTKLEEFRQTVMDMVRNNPSWNSQIVSEEAYKIKSKLREYFERTKSPHITRDEFDEIAKNCGAQNERIKEILKDLHTLGICLWYDQRDMENFNTLVLNPDWITNGIYRIINKSFKEHEHILNVEKGTEILKDDKRYKYPRDKVTFLFRLMKVYELAFFKDKHTDNIFIPGILPIDIPDGLPTFDDASDRLTMSFVVEKALPPNIVTRVIVQRNELGEIFNENLLWRKGAALKYHDGNAAALVVEDARSVTVRVKGVDRTAYIASLRETIKGIFESYQVIKPDLSYEVLIPEEAKASDSMGISEERHESLMLTENTIRDFLEERQDYPYRKKKIPLDRTVREYGIYIGNLNIIYKSKVNDSQIGTTTFKTFNFHDCSINLQGDLNALARSLQAGKQESDEDAEELLLAAEEIEQAQRLIPADNVEIPAEVRNKVKKQGLLNRLKAICDDLNDETSALHEKALKVKHGIQTAQKIAKQYNDIAQWFGLPQVPKPFLGEQGRE
jgi:GTPase SAR1 family protein